MSTEKITPIGCSSFIALILLFLTINCFGQIIKEQKISISGKVMNFNRHKDDNTILFTIRSLVEQGEKKVCAIGEDGRFSLEISIALPQDIGLHYKGYIGYTSLFCRPGDQLQLVINNDTTEGSSRSGPQISNCISITGGDLAAENRDILHFLKERENTLDNTREQAAIEEKTPDEYKQYILLQEQQDKLLLEKFRYDSKSSMLFNQWATDYIKYSALNNLMRYFWINYGIDGQKGTRVKEPTNYFSFLSRYNMDDRAILSAPHADFVHELYMHVTRNFDPDTRARYNHMAKEKDITGMISLITAVFTKRTSGFTRDVFITTLFMDVLNGHQIKEFEDTWHKKLVTNDYFCQMINQKSIAIKAYLQNQHVNNGSNLLKIDQAIIKPLLDTIAKRYAGKVIFIDFWAPWCVPCMEAMPASKNLQTLYKEKDVVFLFLANRCTDESWRATIANKGLTGEHLNLTNDQYNLLAEKFQISGIPHYVLVNKQGSVVNGNAPGPEKSEELTTLINKLLP